MKPMTLILGLLLLFSMSCDQDFFNKGTKQSYQARSNRLNGSSDHQVPAATEESPTPTDGRRIYVVAGTAKTEMAAIQAAQKFQNFGFESNVFRAPNGTYVITVGSTINQTIAEKFLTDNIQQGKLSDRSALSFGTNWTGPIYAHPQSTQKIDTRQPSATNNQAAIDPKRTYIPPQPPAYNTNRNAQPSTQYRAPTPIPGTQASQNVDAFTVNTDQYYLVISRAKNESQALNLAQQYIRQGLKIFVYETCTSSFP